MTVMAWPAGKSRRSVFAAANPPKPPPKTRVCVLPSPSVRTGVKSVAGIGFMNHQAKLVLLAGLSSLHWPTPNFFSIISAGQKPVRAD